mgnify:FL=1
MGEKIDRFNKSRSEMNERKLLWLREAHAVLKELES